MNEFVRQTKNKLTLKEFEVLNTSNLDYVGNYMGFNIQNEEKKLSIKIVFIEVCIPYITIEGFGSISSSKMDFLLCRAIDLDQKISRLIAFR